MLSMSSGTVHPPDPIRTARLRQAVHQLGEHRDQCASCGGVYDLGFTRRTCYPANKLYLYVVFAQAMERQLKVDVLAEVQRNDGRLLVHDEDPDGTASRMPLSFAHHIVR